MVISNRLVNVPASRLARDIYYSNIPKCVFDTYYLDNYTPNTVFADPEGKTIAPAGAYSVTDRFLENASFLRCDNITLGYSFKSYDNYLNGRVFATVQNPFIITKYKGIDPEVASGIDSNPYPRPLSVQLGLNLNF